MPPVTAITSFFFNDTATTEIYTLSLHDALPISPRHFGPPVIDPGEQAEDGAPEQHIMDVRDHVVGVGLLQDRKSTRLNSSHGYISYAVFCLKKKNIITPAMGRYTLWQAR